MGAITYAPPAGSSALLRAWNELTPAAQKRFEAQHPDFRHQDLNQSFVGGTSKAAGLLLSELWRCEFEATRGKATAASRDSRPFAAHAARASGASLYEMQEAPATSSQEVPSVGWPADPYVRLAAPSTRSFNARSVTEIDVLDPAAPAAVRKPFSGRLHAELAGALPAGAIRDIHELAGLSAQGLDAALRARGFLRDQARLQPELTVYRLSGTKAEQVLSLSGRGGTYNHVDLVVTSPPSSHEKLLTGSRDTGVRQQIAASLGGAPLIKSNVVVVSAPGQGQPKRATP